MRIIETTTVKKVFLFSELSEQAQKKAIDGMRDDEPYHGWSDDLTELFTEILEALGFSSIQTEFSGFCVQGDGARFLGEYRHAKGAKERIKKIISHLEPKNKKLILSHVDTVIALQKAHGYKITATVSASDNGYVHSATMRIETEKDVLDPYENQLSHDEDKCLIEAFRFIADRYYSMLDDLYYYLISEKVAKEYIDNHPELEFLENGILYS